MLGLYSHPLVEEVVEVFVLQSVLSLREWLPCQVSQSSMQLIDQGLRLHVPLQQSTLKVAFVRPLLLSDGVLSRPRPLDLKL